MCAGACRRGLAVAVVSTYADDPLPPSPPHRQGHATDLDMIHSVSSTLLQVHFYCLKERERKKLNIRLGPVAFRLVDIVGPHGVPDRHL